MRRVGAALPSIFFSRRGRPLLHVGERKGEHLDAAVRARRPARALELGSYLGYSAVGSPDQPGQSQTYIPKNLEFRLLFPRFASRAAYPMPGRYLAVPPCAALYETSQDGAHLYSVEENWQNAMFAEASVE